MCGVPFLPGVKKKGTRVGTIPAGCQFTHLDGIGRKNRVIVCNPLFYLDFFTYLVTGLDFPKLRWKVKYLHGVQGVEGSNPFTPTI